MLLAAMMPNGFNILCGLFCTLNLQKAVSQQEHKVDFFFSSTKMCSYRAICCKSKFKKNKDGRVVNFRKKKMKFLRIDHCEEAEMEEPV